MRIEWLGHSAFSITSPEGVRILTDPYVSGCYDGAVGYGSIVEEFDIVTVSHAHPDHSGTQGLRGDPRILRGAVSVTMRDVVIKSYATFHDASNGRERGENWIFTFEAGGLRIAHMGDCGVMPSPEIIAALKNVDVLLVPVGGTFTIGAREALGLIRLLEPRLSIPMHFKTPKLGFDIDGVEPFCRLAPNAERRKDTHIECTAQAPLSGIVVLEPSH